jgi:hypothetical protein
VDKLKIVFLPEIMQVRKDGVNMIATRFVIPDKPESSVRAYCNTPLLDAGSSPA